LKSVESCNESSSPPLSQSSQSSSSSNKENHEQSHPASSSSSSSKALFQSPISNQKNSRLKSRGRSSISSKQSLLTTPEKSPVDNSLVNASIINENGQISVHPYLLNSLAKQLKSSEEKVSLLQNELKSIKKQKSSILLSERKELKLKSILQTLTDLANEEEEEEYDNERDVYQSERYETFIHPAYNSSSSSSSSSHFFSPSRKMDMSALNDVPPTELMQRYPLGNTSSFMLENQENIVETGEDYDEEQIDSDEYESFRQLINCTHASSAMAGSTKKAPPGIRLSTSKKRSYNMMKDRTQPQYMITSPELKATIQSFEQQCSKNKKSSLSSSSSSSSSIEDLQNTPSIFDRK
jgi:hypothetical protein